MIQMSNLDDVKSEWNVNETHIIIPMIDGNLASSKESDKNARNTITLNGLDGGDPTVLSNGLEHSLVIGLDRNLFESESNKSDLLVIQNSDLKLLSCNSELKNSIAYTLTYVDQDRNEIVWESSIKDGSKPDWCPSEKPIFEVKDVLNYDDSVQDSSRNWQDELGKSNEQINLENSADLTSQVSKIDDEILIPDENENSVKKTSDDIDGDPHFIVNYYPMMQSCEESSVLSKSPVVNVLKQVKNSNGKSLSFKNENLIANTSKPDTIIKKQFNSSKCDKSHSVESVNPSNSRDFNNDPETVLDLMHQKEVEEYDESFSTVTNLNNYVQYEMKSNLSAQLQNRGKSTKDYDNKAITTCNGVRSSLPEKSLPLKKKAKMKRTIVSENLRLLLRQDIGVHKQSDDTQITNDKKTKFQTKYDSNTKNSSGSDSDEPLISRIKKGVHCGIRKQKKVKKSNESKVKQKINNKKLFQETNHKKINYKLNKNVDDSNMLKSTKGGKSNVLAFSKKKFKNIYDLVEGLKKCKMINSQVGQILLSGLKEMNVDILKEMNTKLNEKAPIESTSYSTQLKVFALVLYFKQPAAFNHLGKLYQNGWPSLSAIKVWKRQMNTHQRVNFRRRRKVDESNFYNCNEM